jgi:hypothetical protein
MYGPFQQNEENLTGFGVASLQIESILPFKDYPYSTQEEVICVNKDLKC